MEKIYHSIIQWREFRKLPLFEGKTIGLVPTMGNLHLGHKSLLMKSVQENDITVLTIFVNPTQFNDQNDLKNYPRTFSQDVKIAQEVGVDYIIAPEYEELYPDNYYYKVCETDFSHQLCGANRPGHFNGVLTVVLKILMLVKACRAYFGEKDFQQFQLIKGMREAFFIDTEIILCPTIRNNRQLALSSRNNLLTAEQLELAHRFPELLNSNYSLSEIVSSLTKLGFSVDYIEEHFDRRFGAVRLGNVRLIDNVLINTNN